MGLLYRAVHAHLGRRAAIKVLRPELATDEQAIDRLLTEARATASVQDPGVVEVYDYGYDERHGAFIAMELLEGETLAQRLAVRGPLPVADAVAIARKIAEPLAAVHAAGVIHRDLKPDNVFLDERDGVALIDFGIAKLEQMPESLRATFGTVIGTPAYMAPEQCVGDGSCDHRADLYALGCLLYEMLAGTPPYSALPPRHVLVAHVRGPVPNIAQRVKVPAELAQLVARLLAKNPAARPGDAAEVAARLDEIEGWLANTNQHTARYLAVDAASGRELRRERSVA
jgi:serine/threonine-protein kinase